MTNLVHTFGINFYGPRNVTIETARYTNGRLAVELFEEGEDFATVSVNLPEADIGLDEFAFKNYSENEGLFEELVRVGAVIFTGRYAHFMQLPVCRLAESSVAPSEHTPAPWIAHNNGVGAWMIELEDGSCIATVGDGVHEGGSPETLEANARLIAAAPRLLERCEMGILDAKQALSGEWQPTAEGWRSIIWDLETIVGEAKHKIL